MVGLAIDAIAVGDRAEITRRASRESIADFVESVGDHNPVHSDREYAAGTMFKEPIAPGIWTAGLVSAVIGTKLPGPGATYLSQSLKFLRPVRMGDLITARVDVLEASPEKNRVRLRTVCANQSGEEVLTGEALVMPAKARSVYARREVGDTLAALTLMPWTWMMQTAAIWTALGFAALGVASPLAPTPGDT